jgi:hypothetical protein
MSDVVFLAHIPLLRVEAESAPFGHGDLWRMPFDHFDALTLGAFDRHRSEYEATAPVFYRSMLDINLPGLVAGTATHSGAIEMKAPSDDWENLERVGLGYFERFQRVLVDPAWAALLLAAPTSALPAPRLSVNFAIAVGDAVFEFRDQRVDKVRIQGDADQEYLFLPEAAGSVLPAEVIAQASEFAESVEEIAKHPEMSAALNALTAVSLPMLTPVEHLMLSVIALEALLLPEVRSGLTREFAKRLASLLAADGDHFTRLCRIAAELYDIRSSALHGSRRRHRSGAHDAADNAYAQQLLAGAIKALTNDLRSVPLLDPVRHRLTGIPSGNSNLDAGLPRHDLPGLRRGERLSRPSPSVVAGVHVGSGLSMDAPAGTMLSWAPLVALGTADTFMLGETTPPVLMPLTGRELLSMEDKDVRRDFAQRIGFEGKNIAVLMTTLPKTPTLELDAAIATLLRSRDLGVVALRLAGFSAFHDPEPLGYFVYDEVVRLRKPTVLRQTLLQMVLNEPDETIAASDAVRIAPQWELLAEYDNGDERHEEIDQVLTIFRRSFYARFIPFDARAALAFGALESMLGRFRPKREPVQLEDLVIAVAGHDTSAATWFTANGRRFRNGLAHGHSRPERADDLTHVLAILRATIPVYIRTWLDAGRPVRSPGAILVASLDRSRRSASAERTR